MILKPDESAVHIPNLTIRNQLKTWVCLMIKIWYVTLRIIRSFPLLLWYFHFSSFCSDSKLVLPCLVWYLHPSTFKLVVLLYLSPPPPPHCSIAISIFLFPAPTIYPCWSIVLFYSYHNQLISMKPIRRSNPSTNVWYWIDICKVHYKKSLLHKNDKQELPTKHRCNDNHIRLRINPMLISLCRCKVCQWDRFLLCRINHSKRWLDITRVLH